MKHKIIYQHDDRDCGAACLSMILHFYGLKLPLAKCREITGTDREGTSIYGLIKGAGKVGLVAQGLVGDMDELLESIQSKEISVPFIAHVAKENGQGHFVVVSSLKNRKLVILDPAIGKYVLSCEEFIESWLGNIVIFSKTPEFKKGNLLRGSFSKFFILLKGQLTKLTLAFILSLLLAFLGIFCAFMFQIIVDEFGVTTGYYDEIEECTDEDCNEDHNHSEENIFVHLIEYIDTEAGNYQILFVATIFLYLIQGIIQFLRTCLISKTVQKVDLEIAMDYYSHLIRLPMNTIHTRKTGEYLSRFADTAIIRDIISQVAITIVLDVLMTIACGVILALQSKEMFLVSLGIMTLHIIVVITSQKPLDNINREVMENSAEVESFVKETIDGVETIKVWQKENNIIDKCKKKYQHVTEATLKETLISETQNIFSEIVDLVGTVIIMWLGFELVLSQHITIGTLLSFFIMLGYFTSPIKNLIQLQPMIQTAVIAADRLNDILEMSIENSESLEMFVKNWQEIKYSNIYFQYREMENILAGIDICVKHGEKIAIVGESGSGKTSLAKLLVGLYVPTSGSITIDDRDINLQELRTHIMYVKQDSYIFTDTLRNNLAMENTNISPSELDNVCEICMLNDLVSELPGGYDYGISEMGENLSAGQRQRLSIARALLCKPDVLILDEATSNLDTITESHILNNLFQIKDLTIIIISHQLSTITQCNKIIVMSEGTIAEIGSHKDLLEKKGMYSKLWENGVLNT